MRLGFVIRLLFIQYCVAAGILLIFAPWSLVWNRIVMQLPHLGLLELLQHPGVRGAVTGFGLVHLVWGAHDLLELLSSLTRVERSRLERSRVEHRT